MLKASERVLFPHQNEAVDATCKVLANTSRTTGVLPCGTGKTRVGAEVAHRIAAAGQGQRLVVVPTLELVHQTMREWADHLGRPSLGRIVAVCSDKEILSARRSGLQAQTADTAVTVDPAHLARLTSTAGQATIACTYASLGVLAEAQARHGLPAPDVAVIDEAHRTAGAAGKSWAAIHYDDVVAAGRRLYLTATPRVVTGDQDDVISMSDERLYGPVAYRMSFATAIQLGLLANYRLVVPVVTSEQVRALLGKADAYLKVGNAGIAASMLATQLAVLRAAREHGIRRMITYHRSVQEARWFATLLPHTHALLDADERPASVWATWVSGYQCSSERRSAMGRLGGEDDGLVVVSNAKVLSEGVDVPAVDAVCFFNPRGMIGTIQGTGRALRRGDRSKPKTASIIVPVVLDPGQDPETGLASSAFGTVWQTVRALASHDDTLSLELESARRSLAEPQPSARYGASGELPDWLSITGVPVPEGFTQAVTVRTVRMATGSWPEYIRAAELYRDEYGDLLIPYDHRTPTGLGLGTWINNVRSRYREGVLTAEQIQEMEALGMVWKVRDHELQQLIRELRAFKEEHGHLVIPNDYEVQQDGLPYKLGQIASTLRYRHARKEVDSAKRQALDAEGFIWDLEAHTWSLFLADLSEFKQHHGHLDVPQKCVMHGREVGMKVNSCRHRRSQLTETEQAQLDEIGFVWDSLQFRYDMHIQALKDFKAEHGHLHIPRTLVVTSPITMRPSHWLNTRVQEFRKGKLSDARITQLLELGVQLTHERRSRS
ncbi:Helicase associated domain protein [Streptomyces phaeochromogenes]|uniref:DEAD/DEAH box helicase n=1 Tax=Streptomyces phaeochromogenes TaxID=1923 RepID=UPI0033F07A4F